MKAKFDRSETQAAEGKRMVLTLPDGEEFVITEQFGRLRIMGNTGFGREMFVKPCSANEIEIMLTEEK